MIALCVAVATRRKHAKRRRELKKKEEEEGGLNAKDRKEADGLQTKGTKDAKRRREVKDELQGEQDDEKRKAIEKLLEKV